MPIYEYECRKCGHQVEIRQRFSDQPMTVCESCGGKMKKLISQSTFHLKGTGWYVTDYASKSGGQSGKSPDKGAESTNKDSSKDSKEASSKESKETPAKKDNIKSEG